MVEPRRHTIMATRITRTSALVFVGAFAGLACGTSAKTDIAKKTINQQTEGPTAFPDDKSKPPSFPGPTKPTPTVVIDPLDLSTSVGDGPFVVTLDNLGAPVGPQLLQSLQSQVALVTWPELANVPVTQTVTDTTGAPGTDARAHIQLQPQSKLSDR